MVIQGAEAMQHKLGHYKLKGTLRSANAALIVTEKVGPRDEDPLSLSGLLQQAKLPDECLRKIAHDVVAQLRALGECDPQVKPIKALIWPHHDLPSLREIIMQYAQADTEEQSLIKPLELLEDLLSEEGSIRFNEQSFLHGDMHVENVALDVEGDDVRAYIFDAGLTRRHVNIRDVAALEVSLLLHQVRGEGSLVDSCRSLYLCDALFAEGGAKEAWAESTYGLIRHLRSAIVDVCSAEIYALMVFDYTLVQCGSLRFGLSNNKIAIPTDAINLAFLAAYWYVHLREVPFSDGA